MAHSNHYFHMPTMLSPERHIDLLSRTEEYGESGEVFDNIIQMVVKGPIYGSTTIKEGEVGIWLTEKEQDDLIAGILERRGVSITTLKALEPQKAEIFTKENSYIIFGTTTSEPINPYCNQKSKIHPPA